MKGDEGKELFPLPPPPPPPGREEGGSNRCSGWKTFLFFSFLKNGENALRAFSLTAFQSAIVFFLDGIKGERRTVQFEFHLL